VARVVTRVLDRHDLLGPHADVEGLEVATRVSPSGERTRFVLNHAAAPVTVTAQVAGTDALTGLVVREGDALTLAPTQVLVLRG
jgi:beta-galactosidase